MDGLEVGIHLEAHHLLILTHARLSVSAHLLLKEVVLVLQTNLLHEREGIGGRICLRIAELEKQAIRHELNILTHHLGVHANQVAGQGLGNELLLNLHGITNNLVRLLLTELVHQLAIQKTGELRVKSLVPSNELI